MLLHSDQLFSIAFGNKKNSFQPEELSTIVHNKNLLKQANFASAQKIMQLDLLVTARQTHSTKGIVITDPNAIPRASDQKEADFLITNLSHVGIGVATADCLPIVFYDNSAHAIGVTHAGWRGSLDGIAIKTVQALQKHCGARLDCLKIFFGPCAKVASYEVQDDFTEKLDQCPFKKQVLIKKNGKTFFNLPLYNQLLLENLGIPRSAFKLDYNLCTITNSSFCSYRRDQDKSCRQMTIAVLK